MSRDIKGSDLLRACEDRRVVELVGQFGRGYHREIRTDWIEQVFIVLDHNEEVLRTGDGDQAVAAYNSIQPWI